MSASIPVLFVCILQYEEILRPKARWGRHRRVAKRGMALLKAIAADPNGSERKWAAAINVNRRVVQGAINALKAVGWWSRSCAAGG